MSETNRIWFLTAGAPKKSTATVSPTWFLRNLHQIGDGGSGWKAMSWATAWPLSCRPRPSANWERSRSPLRPASSVHEKLDARLADPCAGVGEQTIHSRREKGSPGAGGKPSPGPTS